MPEGPRLEAGAASEFDLDDRWRVRLSFAASLDNDGSHFEDEGVDGSGATVPTALHEHVVKMTAWRTVLDLEYLAASDLAFRLKMPFEFRDRSASVNAVGTASAADRANAQRGLDLHHPDATLSGVRDFELTAATWWRNAVTEDDRFEFAYGISLPFGETEPDPYARDGLGNLVAHEHVQFGTGTFDPLIQVTWATRFREDWAAGFYAAARYPFYENHHDYRAPREVTLSGSLGRAMSERWHLRGVVTTLWSSKAEWDGAPDVNTGWLAWYLGGGAEYRAESWSASFQVLLPVSQDTLGAGSETFDLGPVLTFAVLLPF